MTVKTYPKLYQSAFREACFTLDGLTAPSGTDVRILSPSHSGTLGVKRVYAVGEASVNVAPYVRRLLSPEPLCASPQGVVVGPGRTVTCSISAENYTSPAVYLTAGSHDAPVNSILSAAPGVSKIRFGESDEISVIAGGNKVRPLITFSHDGAEYTDSSQPFRTDAGMLTFVVNADAAAALFSGFTGADPSEMTGFAVRLQIIAGSSETSFTRRYEIDRSSSSGRRLAWVNRYGAVDYYTFPYTGGGKVSGRRERIYTPAGYRTVATAAEISETLISEPCDPAAAKWLGEIFSSPAVWTVDGKSCERVEVENGSAEYSSARPGTVAVSIGPARKTFSRRF